MSNTGLDDLERWLRRLGGGGALLVLICLYAGLWRSLRQTLAGAGQKPRPVRRGAGLLAASALFFGACVRGWRPLPWRLTRVGRALTLALGAPLLAAGLGLVAWGQAALGEMFNYSTGLGAPLYAQQRLITTGPYALVRHPMYAGYNLAALGALLLYRTWTALLLVPAAMALVFRARREEAALAEHFGAAWSEYGQRVPGWLPRLRRR